MNNQSVPYEVGLDLGDIKLRGILAIPRRTEGIVLFAHGSGSGRLSPRNEFVAQDLQNAGIATLLMDLLTGDESEDRGKVFDIPLLTERLLSVTDWVGKQTELSELKIGYFGASTGAAAALQAAAKRPYAISAVVSRGGRPDLAGEALKSVQAPTLLIVGGEDFGVIEPNEEAFLSLECEKKFEIIPGATHLFEEPGTLEEVAILATAWFKSHLRPPQRMSPPPKEIRTGP